MSLCLVSTPIDVDSDEKSVVAVVVGGVDVSVEVDEVVVGPLIEQFGPSSIVGDALK